MASYCECGHVWEMHMSVYENGEEEPSAILCTDLNGCECEFFYEIDPKLLNKGWD